MTSGEWNDILEEEWFESSKEQEEGEHHQGKTSSSYIYKTRMKK